MDLTFKNKEQKTSHLVLGLFPEGGDPSSNPVLESTDCSSVAHDLSLVD